LVHVVEIVCGGLEGGDGGGFGAPGWLMFVLRDALARWRWFVLHDAFDEFGHCALSFCFLGDFGAWGEVA
jgi:hypothetical protein